MGISIKEFDQLAAVATSELPARILRVLDASDEALTADEVAAALLGITNRYTRVLSLEIGETAEIIAPLLDSYVLRGRLRSLSVNHPVLGPRLHYATGARPREKA